MNDVVTDIAPKGVFLSYCHRDRKTALSLKEGLEKLGVAVRLDADGMQPGQGIQQFICESIRGTVATVWLVSESSLVSEWVSIEIATTLADSDLWSKRLLVACYLDESFLEPEFRLRATTTIDGRISELDKLIPEYIQKTLDTVDINAEKSRLHELRTQLGKVLQRLRDSLCVDVREPEFAISVERLANALRPLSPGKQHVSLSAAGDVELRKQEIYDAIANSDGDRALKRLMDFVKDFSRDKRCMGKVVVIAGNYRKLESVQDRPLKEIRKEREELLYEALDLVEAIIDSLTPKVT
jgi:hypothetical protein